MEQGETLDLNILHSILLGIVQGFTEFLPVSSSGHLVIFTKIFNEAPNVPFDIMLHIATMLAVCIYFAKDIYQIIKSFLKKWDLNDPHFKLGLLIIVASVPTAIIGYSLSDYFEAMFSSLMSVGAFLILTGALITLAESYGKAKKGIKKMSFLDSIIIGIAQGCAIAPGLSRSGTTISASLLLGLERSFAARFSFLLSIPAIFGASIFKSKAILSGINIGVIAGFIAALISGYIAIWLFVRIIQKNNILGFAYYCFVAGGLSILASLFF
jgi:undecaprenyl-diphosphatase